MSGAWLQDHPVEGTAALAGCTLVTFACYRIGSALLAPSHGLPERERSLLGRYLAWPGGTWVAFAAGAIVLSLLLIPDRRLDGRWRWRWARLAWWTTFVFAALQLLDDHVMGQPGTNNPSGISIPYPIQDLAEIPCLGLLLAASVGALVTMPSRISRTRLRG